MGVDVGAVGAVGWFWLKVVGVAKSLPFMGLEVVGSVGPSELARGDFGATVGRASLLFALSLAPLPSEGHRGVGAGWLYRVVVEDEGLNCKARRRCHPHGCHCSFGSYHTGSYVERPKTMY